MLKLQEFLLRDEAFVRAHLLHDEALQAFALAVANEYERQVARQHRATCATPEADSASESEFILSSESDAEG